MYFSIDYYRFRNYQNIDAVLVSDNIVSISFSRKKVKMKVICLPIDRFRWFSSLTPKDFDHRAPHPGFNGNDGHAQ
jgi:hypothetical protein